MYGHTFLRMDKGLTSYSVNFAAETNQTMGAGYAMKGLSGAYPGKFTTIPYYMKIQEYNNLESRDLWEYQLNLSSAEIRSLVLHLWELGPAYMKYYFLTKNCSYQLLPLMEAARPGVKLSNRFRWMTIPADTLRAVRETPGLVTDINVRPSAVTKMLAARANLRREEIKIAGRIARNPNADIASSLQSVDEKRKGIVLQSAFLYYRYLNGFARFQEIKRDAREHSMLLELNRHQVPEEKNLLSPAGFEAPEDAHRTSRAMWSTGRRMGDWFQEISLRPALHDFLDPDYGYIPHSRLEMFHLKARYVHSTQKFHVSQFVFADLASLSSWDPWVRKPSFNIWAGYETRKGVKESSWDQGYARVKGGAGLSKAGKVLGRELALYALPQIDLGAGPAFSKKNRVGTQVMSGAIFEPVSFIKMGFESDYNNYFVGDEDDFWGLRASVALGWKRSGQARISYENENDIEEWKTGLNFYW